MLLRMKIEKWLSKLEELRTYIMWKTGEDLQYNTFEPYKVLYKGQIAPNTWRVAFGAEKGRVFYSAIVKAMEIGDYIYPLRHHGEVFSCITTNQSVPYDSIINTSRTYATFIGRKGTKKLLSDGIRVYTGEQAQKVLEMIKLKVAEAENEFWRRISRRERKDEKRHMVWGEGGFGWKAISLPAPIKRRWGGVRFDKDEKLAIFHLLLKGGWLKAGQKHSEVNRPPTSVKISDVERIGRIYTLTLKWRNANGVREERIRTTNLKWLVDAILDWSWDNVIPTFINLSYATEEPKKKTTPRRRTSYEQLEVRDEARNKYYLDVYLTWDGDWKLKIEGLEIPVEYRAGKAILAEIKKLKKKNSALEEYMLPTLLSKAIDDMSKAVTIAKNIMLIKKAEGR